MKELDRDEHYVFTHSWVMNEYLKGINQPAVMRRVDRLMVGDQIDEFNLANTAKREFINMLDRFGALFRVSAFPMDEYVRIRGRYILTIWRLIEKEVRDFRNRAALPDYAKSLEWWAEQIAIESEKISDEKQEKKDRLI